MLTLTDQAGRTVFIEEPVLRIVSGYYISSSVCIALGLADRLVGIEARAETRPIYALSKPELLELPNVGTARDFNLEACLALNPDLVLLPYRLRDAAEIMTEMGISVILVNPESYTEMIGMIELIGLATSVDENANRLIEWINDTRNDIDEVVNAVNGAAEKPGVFITGLSNWLTTASNDMFQAELIGMAGGYNVASGIIGSGWTEISYEQLLAMSPDVIIIASEAGYETADVLDDPVLSELPAILNNRVFKMPSHIEAWDSPIPAAMLGVRWLHDILFEGVNFSDSFSSQVEAFYTEFYSFTTP
jgi:iron complex transport system substrate-binding protein